MAVTSFSWKMHTCRVVTKLTVLAFVMDVFANLEARQKLM
jgi:hypothetical protein